MELDHRRNCFECYLELLADLLADRVLVLVERLLLLLGDVAAVLSGHQALFLADLPIALVQGGSLRPAEFALLYLGLDALVLIAEALVDLLATRVVLLQGVSCSAAITFEDDPRGAPAQRRTCASAHRRIGQKYRDLTRAPAPLEQRRI